MIAHAKKFSPLRARAYRMLNASRRRAGIPVLTIPELNALSLWEIGRLLVLADQKCQRGQTELFPRNS